MANKDLIKCKATKKEILGIVKNVPECCQRKTIHCGDNVSKLALQVVVFWLGIAIIIFVIWRFRYG